MEIRSAGLWMFPFSSSYLLIKKSYSLTNFLFGRYIFIGIYISFLKYELVLLISLLLDGDVSLTGGHLQGMELV